MTGGPQIRVGIDGFNLAMGQGTGVATYGRSLVEACHELGRKVDLVYGLNVPPNARPEQRETLFFAALADRLSSEELPPRWSLKRSFRRLCLRPGVRTLVDVPISGRVILKGVADVMPAFDGLVTMNALFNVGERYLRRFGRLMPVRMQSPPEIMHWTYPVPVRMVGSRNVYTIHDLVPLRLPYLSLEDKRYHERLLHACIDEAAHILTVSEHSRRDILQYLPVQPEKVTNTYQALPARRRAAPAPDALARNLRAIFNLEADGYFLFFGAIEPKKNVKRLIEAYLSAFLDTPLVLAGPAAWRSEDQLRLLEGGGAEVARQEGRIRRLGYLPADHLEQLVAGARAVIFPSLYEGFGLPALEAMSAGAPLIVGSEGALPEIVAGAGVQVDPYDVEAISRALIGLDTDDQLRADLRVAGANRALDFTMAQYCARIDAIHRQLLVEAPYPRRVRDVPKSHTAVTGELM
ncbi:glycosyltransferase family 1 protein [Sphingomonas sp. H39-1-10]|uniref:glycosyltransferase family 4 protein n=1 Tax=Sphingomonas pollutisoli TaxID=3030829 RepID=UPI0023B9EBCD|nr:glycosyltransferase family 1 protein [Sphingomonas pollutisoli]MDF0487757.1 glycosyltransferase family 1 protein [Sphingomonas pollutisoli]